MAKTSAPRIPLRDFFKLPEKANFQISPNGKYLSFLQPWERRLNVHVVERGKDFAGAIRVTGETARDIMGHTWKGNDRLVYLQDKDGDENYHLFSANAQGGDTKDLTPFEGVRAQIVDDLEEIDSEILIGMNKRVAEIFDVYRLNIVTGEITLEAENPGNITGWVTDHNGHIRIAEATDGVNTTFLYRESKDQEFQPIFTTNFRESVSPLFFTFDNKQVYAASNRGRDKVVIVRLDPATGNEEEIIFEHPEVDVSGMQYSKKRKVITEINYTTWHAERQVPDPIMQKIYARLEADFPGQEIVITDMNKEEDLLIVRNVSDRSTGSAWFYDVAQDKLEKLADVMPWLNADDLDEMKPIQYQTRDGLTIHGYLTLPKGVEAKNLPVVVNPHGGPWVRDTWRYNPEVQFLANRGYAVFQMNYRGSTGYGKKFWESSFKQWGKKMQDDVTDGVEWLIKEGIADPKRVAIYGGSYGGYCTLAGVTFTPDLYACGIDYVGVSNLFTFMNTIPPYWKPYLEMMYEMVGDPFKDKELLKSSSPVFHVDKIKAPLFVIQGAKDPRVNIEESNQIVDALRKRGIDVPYMVKENEGHGFHNEENRFEVYEAIEEFLEKHIG